MSRGELLTAMVLSALIVLAGTVTGAGAQNVEHGIDADAVGGYVKTPPRTYMFTDHRLIRAGDLDWLAPDGSRLPLTEPPGSPVDAHADKKFVSYGCRLVAIPARTDPVEGDPPPAPGMVVPTADGYYSVSFHLIYPEGKDLGSYSVVKPKSFSISAARSKDLYTWEQLGETPLPSVLNQTRLDGFAVFEDTHGSANERFKAVWMARPPEEDIAALWDAYQKLHPRYRDVRIGPDKLTCMYGATSPDGAKWTAIDKPLFTHYSDTDTRVVYNEWLGKYVMYTRLYLLERRMVAIAEAEDFRKWEPVRPLLWPGLEEPLSTDVYTNAYTTYPGMPEVHLMFPMYYHRFDQTSDVRLFSSVDGINWSQVPGGPVLSRDSFGDPAIEFMHVSAPLLPLANDRVGVRYSASYYPHKYPRWKGGLKPGKAGWAWWEKGRLAAVKADEEGEFVTFSLPVMGKQLRINARTPRAGWIKVGHGARAIEDCDPIVGDSYSHMVSWNSNTDFGVEPGNNVSIRFHLRKAELFGFEWVD